MAQAANTHDRYDLATSGENVKEQVADRIWNIDPTDCPFTAMAKKTKSTNTLIEFLKDKLDAVDTSNAYVDGDEFSADALVPPVRLQNYHQISKRGLVISRRANKLMKHGRREEVAYEVAKAGDMLKRDVEAILTRNQVAAVGSASVVPTTASLGAWLKTNTNRGATGTDPTLSGTDDGYPNAAAGDGTQRALSEATLHSIMADTFVEGGKPSVLMVGPVVKGRFSNYMFSSGSRIATPYQDHKGSERSGATVLGSVDVFIGDYGALEVTPNRFQRERDVYGLDPRYWAISFIDNMLLETIAQTGDAQKRHLICDYALCSYAEDASFIIADIDETTAMTA